MHTPNRQIIGKGLTSVVYEWGEGRVLKLFEAWLPRASIEREFVATRALHDAGLSVPATYELIELDGRQGIVFERIAGISLFQQVQARPWRLFSAARQLAELHADLHRRPAPSGLRSQHQQIASWIDACSWPDDEKNSARRSLSGLPDGSTICHGDFHPENILLTARGPVIIDWIAATRGHPLGDVARTSLLFEVANFPEDAPRHMHFLLKIARTALHATYLRRYFQIGSGRRAEISGWRTPLMAGVSAWRERRGGLE